MRGFKTSGSDGQDIENGFLKRIAAAVARLTSVLPGGTTGMFMALAGATGVYIVGRFYIRSKGRHQGPGDDDGPLDSVCSAAHRVVARRPPEAVRTELANVLQRASRTTSLSDRKRAAKFDVLTPNGELRGASARHASARVQPDVAFEDTLLPSTAERLVMFGGASRIPSTISRSKTAQRVGIGRTSIRCIVDTKQGQVEIGLSLDKTGTVRPQKPVCSSQDRENVPTSTTSNVEMQAESANEIQKQQNSQRKPKLRLAAPLPAIAERRSRRLPRRERTPGLRKAEQNYRAIATRATREQRALQEKNIVSLFATLNKYRMV